MTGPQERKRRTERSPYRVAVSDEDSRLDKHFAPSAARNVGPIVAVLRDVLPRSGRALEIASGTGQHVVAFAAAFPGIDWQPSDPDRSARASIAVWAAESGADNVAAPLEIDVTGPDWQAAQDRPIDAIVCSNLLHISPWAACEGLLRGAAHLLTPSGLLFVYGPFRRGGRHTAPSNAEFDRSLRHRNPAWGVRDLDEVADVARINGLGLDRVVDMPANNLSVVFHPLP